VYYEHWLSSFWSIILRTDKAFPVTDHGGPQGCDTLRLSHFLENRLRDGREVFNLTVGCPLPPGRLLAHISVIGCVDPWVPKWLEELGQLKNPMTSSGIELATFWLI
jgi:hypothetical protein